MQVRIIETGDLVALSLPDESGHDWIWDAIGLYAAGSKFNMDPEKPNDRQCTIAHEATVRWWQEHLEMARESVEQMRALAREIGVSENLTQEWLAEWAWSFTEGFAEAPECAEWAMEALREHPDDIAALRRGDQDPEFSAESLFDGRLYP